MPTNAERHARIAAEIVKRSRSPLLGGPVSEVLISRITAALASEAERADGMRAALQAVHDWRGLCDASALETTERIATLFYSDTGMLAPGKDQAAALGGFPTREERGAAWASWVKAKNDALDDQIRAALLDGDGAGTGEEKR